MYLHSELNLEHQHSVLYTVYLRAGVSVFQLAPLPLPLEPLLANHLSWEEGGRGEGGREFEKKSDKDIQLKSETNERQF